MQHGIILFNEHTFVEKKQMVTEESCNRRRVAAGFGDEKNVCYKILTQRDVQ